MRRLYVRAVETVCNLLDHVPYRDSIDGHWYRMSDLGCRLGLSLHSVNMNDRWGLDVWKEPA